MCVILVSPNGKKFDVKELEAAQAANYDGVGLAWRTDNGLIAYRKFEKFDAEQWRQPPGTCVIHFRLATAGGSAVEMAHPFPITRSAGVRRWGKAKRVLFHNGHLPGWEYDARDVLPKRLKKNSGPWSDSRLLAFCVHRFGEKHVAAMADNYYQRVAIFDDDGVGIFGKWEQDEINSPDGIFRSNLYHQGLMKTKTGFGGYSAHDWEYIDWDEGLHSRATVNTANHKTVGLPPIGTRTPHVNPPQGTPGLLRECCSFDPTHQEHLCLECNEVICPNCCGWGNCLMHASIKLVEEPSSRYAG